MKRQQKRKARVSEGDDVSIDSGDKAREESHDTSDSDGPGSESQADDSVLKKKHAREGSELSDTEKLEDVSKKRNSDQEKRKQSRRNRTKIRWKTYLQSLILASSRKWISNLRTTKQKSQI